jgi:L-lactate dehydrogenase (cytochrome)
MIGVGVGALTTIFYASQLTPILLDSKQQPLELTPEIVSQHNTRDDLWIVLNGKVYDLTNFLTNHPGGQKILLKYGGKDATKIFTPIHPPDAIEKFLPAENYLGPLVGEFPEEEEILTDEEMDRLDLIERKPPLSQIINIHDFECVARQILPPQALAYYSSAADDEITLRENHNAYHRIFFQPKILVDVKEVDISTEFFGNKTSAPFYASATALAKLGHPDGEVSIARGTGKEDVVQMISTLASCSFDEIADARVKDDQQQWYQLYVNSDRALTERQIKHAEQRGMKGLFITVDAPSLGRREKDMKMKFDADADIQDDENIDRSQGASRALSSFIDPSLCWKDIDHIRTLTKMPIVIKGIQRKQDVLLAAEHGCQGVVLSNHGGRQLDFSRAPVEVLAEVMPELRARGLDKTLEVYVDGGIRRGTDILKALCLGAKGVGLGRAFLYANSAYGEAGVRRACQLLKDELEMNMRLLGVNKIEELTPELLDTSAIHNRSVSVARDNLYRQNYAAMENVEFKPEEY